MNPGWLLRSRTLWWALGLSSLSSVAILTFAPDGLGDLRKREAELRAFEAELRQKAQRNRELTEEVQRLAAQDPELFEALARRQGFSRPGETVYTFREKR